MTDATLSTVCSLIVDCEHRTAPAEPSGTHPLIRTPDIGAGRLLFYEAQQISEDTYREWTKRAIPQPGDLILAREAPVGNVGIIPPGVAPALGQRTVLLRPDPSKVDPYYLNYLMSGSGPRAWMDAVSAGATVPHLNVADIRALPLPRLPPLAVQREIGAILAAYDALIENNRQRVKILEEMAQRIYLEWFVDFRYPGHEDNPLVDAPKGQIPQGWHWCRLGDLVIEVRDTIRPQHLPASTPYFGLEHLPERSIALGDWGRPADATSLKFRFQEGDILFGKIRAYFHKVGPPPVAGICSTDAIVIRTTTKRDWPLVLAIVSSDGFVAHAVQTSQGTKMPRASWDVLREYPVAYPDDRTLSRFGELIGDTASLIQHFVLANRILREARDILLPHLISGEINVENLEIAVQEAAV